MQTKANNDEKGATKLRDGAMNQVELDLIALLAWVQGLANAALTVEIAEAIIVSSNFKVIVHTRTPKAPLAATWGKLTGTIKVIGKSLRTKKSL